MIMLNLYWGKNKKLKLYIQFTYSYIKYTSNNALKVAFNYCNKGKVGIPNNSVFPAVVVYLFNTDGNMLESFTLYSTLSTRIRMNNAISSLLHTTLHR